MIDMKKDLSKISENIIIDCAAGLGNEAMSAIKMADELILVTNPEMPAITDALKTIKMAEQEKIPVKGIIMTKVMKNDIEMQPETVKDMLEVPILGMVPYDLSVSKSLNEKDAVVHTEPKSSAARAYKEIAANLLGVEYDSDKDKETFWERISKAFSKN
jgi:septum site-determining protein MinD